MGPDMTEQTVAMFLFVSYNNTGDLDVYLAGALNK